MALEDTKRRHTGFQLIFISQQIRAFQLYNKKLKQMNGVHYIC